MSKSSKDKARNSSPLTVRLPISRDYAVDKLAKWLNSLEGASEESLDLFINSELKLIILSARDREKSLTDLNHRSISVFQNNVSSLTENMIQLTKRVDENSSLLTDSSSNLKSYAEAVVGNGVSCEQIRSIIKEEDNNRRVEDQEDNEKKLRNKNFIVYGLSEDVLPSDCSKEFLNIVGEWSLKPKIIEMCRLGKLREDNKPRPIRVKLESRDMRYKIISHAYRLKNHPRLKNIYLKPDLTKNEDFRGAK